MISLWITIGLVLSAAAVASLGAFFSITGLGALFSGAVVAVALMAASLEFAKFVLAAYLHQTWTGLNKIYRSYLVFSVVVLSVITSIGIFGFLSDAYQSASTVLDAENIKLAAVKSQQAQITAEIQRLNRSVDEIPQSRVSKRLKLRAEIEPSIKELNKKFEDGEKVLASANLTILEVKKKVGPLIYISRAFSLDIDSVVKYLILIFVMVFDPLAICLVIASTHAIESRRNRRSYRHLDVEDQADVKKEEKVEVKTPTPPAAAAAAVAAPEVTEPEDIIVQMNFKDPEEDKKAV